MIEVRIGAETFRLETEEWERWVEDGRIPPDALVRVGDAAWSPARHHPDYRRIAGRARPAAPPAGPGIRSVLLPRRGVSATEAILLVNAVLAVVPMLLYGRNYEPRLLELLTRWWGAVHFEHAVWWWLPTIVLHADPPHIIANLVALLVGAGFTEVLMGRRWTLAAYLVTGLAGAAVSYWVRNHPPLSVGASGAAFGYLGMLAGFLIRRGTSFGDRERWRARRVYAPLVVFLLVPAVFRNDLFAHMGGFAAGLLLGLVARPHARPHGAPPLDSD